MDVKQRCSKHAAFHCKIPSLCFHFEQQCKKKRKSFYTDKVFKYRRGPSDLCDKDWGYLQQNHIRKNISGYVHITTSMITYNFCVLVVHIHVLWHVSGFTEALICEIWASCMQQQQQRCDLCILHIQDLACSTSAGVGIQICFVLFTWFVFVATAWITQNQIFFSYNLWYLRHLPGLSVSP